MKGLLLVMYLALGLVQSFAIFAGLIQSFAVQGLPALVLAPLVAYTPLIGTAAAFFLSMQAWGLTAFQAGTLFVGPFTLIAVAWIAVRTAGRAPDAAVRRKRRF